ncbi:hypothetical protein Dsin_021941 [Dipteronia sinensis]|uniref:Uncharacterized protein n=1 Tax=Dipteronia sinensis TaxID=43782 RepID=A0AAE0A1X2_9ROSI|nr:hypothetical protein Dsin_021941 [Dipteronia sinensis]
METTIASQNSSSSGLEESMNNENIQELQAFLERNCGMDSVFIYIKGVGFHQYSSMASSTFKNIFKLETPTLY